MGSHGISQHWSHTVPTIIEPLTGLTFSNQMTESNSSYLLWTGGLSSSVSLSTIKSRSQPLFGTKHSALFYCSEIFHNFLSWKKVTLKVSKLAWDTIVRKFLEFLQLNLLLSVDFIEICVKFVVLGNKLVKSWITFSLMFFTTRMSFGQRPTSRLLIESQTLAIWSYNDLDLGLTLTLFMTLTSYKSNQVKLMSR